MKRTEWQFRYPGARVLDAAQRQHLYRTERVAFWKDKRDEAMSNIRYSGLNVNETEVEKLMAGGNYGTANFGNAGAVVTINQEYLTAFREADAKWKENARIAREYEQWIAVLTENVRDDFDLDFEDYLFFFQTR